MPESILPPVAPPAPRRLRRALAIALAVALASVVIGVAMRVSAARELARWTDAQALPTVTVVTPERGGADALLDLPGRIEAFAQAPIHARVSGYLKSWQADIGAQVKAGQVLAEVETPELDQELLQARADLASARANAALAATTATRWQSMLKSDSVSRQEVDEKTGDHAAKEALARAAAANVSRLEAMQRYARITAPFAGTVIARNTDVGALINAGGSGAGAALFVVADTRKLRVYVQVPQSDMATIRPGTAATLDVPEYPGQEFAARVEASAQAVNAATGSTLVQLLVDNADGRLLPGSFANVHFRLPPGPGHLRVPASALVFDADGLHVATVGAGDKVVFRKVTIARDFGKTLEIGAGLEADDRVIDSPSDGLVAGEQVMVMAPAASGEATAHARH